jgi:hypothetical protein
MASWKYTGKEVSATQARQSIEAVKSACFHCEVHNDDCPLAKAVGEISPMLE